jgi:hypothetical protein
VDLNNIYSETEHENLELLGGQEIVLESIGGAMGFRRLTGTVPAATAGIQTLLPVPDDEQCTLDTIGPVIDEEQLQPAPEMPKNDDTPLISAIYSDQYSEVDPGSVRLEVDGEDVSSEVTADSVGVEYTPAEPLSEGVHSVTLSVSDEWGYEGESVTWSFEVDLTPPVVAITKPVNGDYLYPPAQIVKWSVDDPVLTDLTLSLNGTPESLSPEAVEWVVTLEAGTNLIGIAATDEAGNTGTGSVEVILDVDTDGDGTGNNYDPDDDNDGMPDAWELTYNLDPLNLFDAGQDEDGDGFANLTEYTAGTEPRDPESYPAVDLTVKYITVTDVTPESFSVIWQSSEPSACSLLVYDENGAPLSDLEIESESADHYPAEDIGVMKVTVSGLDSGTTYGFQTLTISKADDLAIFTPVYPELQEVITETGQVTVENDLIKQMIYDENGDPADGALLVASVEGGDYPIAVWVGEGMTSPWARVDLNRVYSEATHQNLQLLGDEELKLWGFGGLLGHYVNVQEIPAPAGAEETALPESCHLNTENGCSLDLKRDLNVVGAPFLPIPAHTSHSLLLYLKEQAGGDAGVIENIKRYNTETARWEMASWFEGQPAGPDFPIKAGEAYLIYLSEDMSGVWFEGVAHGAAVGLSVGLTLVSLPAAQDPIYYTSYEMLEDLGSETQVSSVKRYDNTYGWQTASWFMGQPSGKDFETIMGEGYLIYMKEDMVNWRPY